MKPTNKRKDTPDSKIMDALDASDYSIHRASTRLGVHPSTLYRWISDSPNLKKYIAHRLEFDAVKAREKLEHMLEHADALDPKQMGHVISICKILLDKAEANKAQLEIDHVLDVSVNEEVESKIRKLLGEE
jgi:hypothetical protein